MSTRRYHGQRPRWEDPNVTNREQLQKNLLRVGSPPDPLGHVAKAHARESGEQYISEQAAADPFYRSSDWGMNQAQANAQMNASGWGGYLQALKEAAQRIAGPGATLRVAGGPSPKGSNQLRGTSLQLNEKALPIASFGSLDGLYAAGGRTRRPRRR